MRSRASSVRPGAALVVLAALLIGVVFVWGGYAAGWRWTGLSSQVTLWDWLEALALPVTVGLVPLTIRHRGRLHRRHQVSALAGLALFVVLVLAGYLVPMRWTGFTGNTLWDWLSLALLPLVIATSTLWHRPPRWSARHGAVLVGGVLLVVVLVALGYLVPWDWTGFTGNTAWDWIKLLLLPVLLPVFVLPRLVRAADTWMTRQEPPVADPTR
ncbi:MAG: hypothetical protein ACRDPI_02315 [Nocardioidaceae bacterium]